MSGTFRCDTPWYGACCACPVAGTILVMDLRAKGGGGALAVRSVTAGDLDGDGRTDLIVAGDTGITAHLAAACGGFTVGTRALDDVKIVSVAAAQLVTGGPMEVVALGADRTVYALGGSDLKTLFSTQLTDPASIVTIVPAHLDTDGDHDIVAIRGGEGAFPFGSLLYVENTGSAWNVRATAQLPRPDGGIGGMGAGDLGGNARDELLLFGGGLVEVVSVGDFDFSDARALSASRGVVTFGDFDHDGKPDALVSVGDRVEIWAGDGATNLTQKPTVAIGGTVIDLSTTDRDGDGKPEVVALLAGGSFVVLSGAGLSMQDKQMGPASAVRAFGGDVDGDKKGDVFVVGSDGTVAILRTP